MKKTEFYLFDQTNSGGFFDVDENVCRYVIIEALDKKQARTIFKPMIRSQSASCYCCGDRWEPENPEKINLEKYKNEGYTVRVLDYSEKTEKIWAELYGKFPLFEKPEWSEVYGIKKFEGKIYFDSLEQYLQIHSDKYIYTTPNARIHYLDGTKKDIFNNL